MKKFLAAAQTAAENSTPWSPEAWEDIKAEYKNSAYLFHVLGPDVMIPGYKEQGTMPTPEIHPAAPEQLDTIERLYAATGIVTGGLTEEARAGLDALRTGNLDQATRLAEASLLQAHEARSKRGAVESQRHLVRVGWWISGSWESDNVQFLSADIHQSLADAAACCGNVSEVAYHLVFRAAFESDACSWQDTTMGPQDDEGHLGFEEALFQSALKVGRVLVNLEA